MGNVDDDFADWKHRVRTWGDDIGLAGYLLGLSSLVGLTAAGTAVAFYLPPGRYLLWGVLLPGVFVAWGWFWLTAPLFYRWHVAMRRRWPMQRPARKPSPRQGDAAFASGWTLRCGCCRRPTAARWRRCPFCRGATGTLRGRRYFVVDERLSGLRSLGLGAGLAFVLLGALTAPSNDQALFVTGFLCIAFLVAHLIAPWHLAGWVASLGGWILVTGGTAFLVREEGASLLVVLLPLGVVAWMMLRWRQARARLLGEEDPSFVETSNVPSWSPCVECGSRDAELVAPLYCVSVGVTVRWALPLQSRCRVHARARALGPSLVTMLCGWWGFPGVFWAAEALALNLSHGGATLHSSCLRKLRSEEEREGRPDGASTAFEFTAGFALGLCLLFATFSAFSAAVR